MRTAETVCGFQTCRTAKQRKSGPNQFKRVKGGRSSSLPHDITQNEQQKITVVRTARPAFATIPRKVTGPAMYVPCPPRAPDHKARTSLCPHQITQQPAATGRSSAELYPPSSPWPRQIRWPELRSSSTRLHPPQTTAAYDTGRIDASTASHCAPADWTMQSHWPFQNRCKSADALPNHRREFTRMGAFANQHASL